MLRRCQSVHAAADDDWRDPLDATDADTDPRDDAETDRHAGPDARGSSDPDAVPTGRDLDSRWRGRQSAGVAAGRREGGRRLQDRDLLQHEDHDVDDHPPA
jgi:hypothetical protein